MRHSYWPDNSNPQYLNPTFEEIVELASSKPDTLRIIDGDTHFGVASGCGNTHDTVVRACRIMLNDRRWGGLDYILFREGGEWFWDLMNHGTTEEKKSIFIPNMWF